MCVLSVLAMLHKYMYIQSRDTDLGTNFNCKNSEAWKVHWERLHEFLLPLRCCCIRFWKSKVTSHTLWPLLQLWHPGFRMIHLPSYAAIRAEGRCLGRFVIETGISLGSHIGFHLSFPGSNEEQLKRIFSNRKF